MAEFEWINKQGVRSEKGFIVQRTGRYTMEYCEGEHAMVFFLEPVVDPDTGNSSLIVQVYPFPAWGGPSAEHRHKEIIESLRRAIVFKGLVPFFRTDSGNEYKEDDV